MNYPIIAIVFNSPREDLTMRVKYIFSSNPRAARLMAVISGIILALLLAVTLILWGIVFYQRHCWSPVTAEVTAHSGAGSSDVWTEFTFTYEDSSYTVRQRGHSYWMYPGLKLPLYCNPANPQEFCVAENMDAVPKTAATAAGIWAVLAVLMLLNYIRVRKK